MALLGAVHKRRHQSRGEGEGFAKRWSYLISLFGKNDDEGGRGGSKISKNWWRLLWTAPFVTTSSFTMCFVEVKCNAHRAMGGKISAKTGMNFRGNECPVPRLEICLWICHWFGTKSNQFQIRAKSEAKNKLEICLWFCLWFYTDFSSLPNQWQSQRQISSLGTDQFLSLKLFPVLALIWHWWVTSGLNSL